MADKVPKLLDLTDPTGDDAPAVELPKLGRRRVVMDRGYAEELALEVSLVRLRDMQREDGESTDREIERLTDGFEIQKAAVREILGLSAEEVEQVRPQLLTAVIAFYQQLVGEQSRAGLPPDPTEPT